MNYQPPNYPYPPHNQEGQQGNHPYPNQGQPYGHQPNTAQQPYPYTNAYGQSNVQQPFYPSFDQPQQPYGYDVTSEFNSFDVVDDRNWFRRMFSRRSSSFEEGGNFTFVIGIFAIGLIVLVIGFVLFLMIWGDPELNKDIMRRLFS